MAKNTFKDDHTHKDSHTGTQCRQGEEERRKKSCSGIIANYRYSMEK